MSLQFLVVWVGPNTNSLLRCCYNSLTSLLIEPLQISPAVPSIWAQMNIVRVQSTLVPYVPSVKWAYVPRVGAPGWTTLPGVGVIDFYVLPRFLRPRMTVQTHCQYSDAGGPQPFSTRPQKPRFWHRRRIQWFDLWERCALLCWSHMDWQCVHCHNISNTTYLGCLLGNGSSL